jgi:hypothetical protein
VFFISSLWLKVSTLHANFSLSSSHNGIVKKQSFKSTIRGQCTGMALGVSNLGRKGPMGCITLLIALKSYSSFHFSDFFGTIKMGVFHGLVVGSICSVSNCCFTSSCKYCNFSPLIYHCSTHAGFSVSHYIGKALQVGGRINSGHYAKFKSYPIPVQVLFLLTVTGEGLPCNFFLNPHPSW